MKNKCGLVSISFRGLTAEEIIKASAKASLSFIEWGGDIHCKPMDLSAINKVLEISEKYGIEPCAYGSYYRVGAKEQNFIDFPEILSAATALGVDIIRVWAYIKGSAETTAEEYAEAVGDMKRICGMAEERNVKISLECHNNTLTDDYHSTLKLLSDCGCDNLTMYWQPNQFKSIEYNMESAEALKDYITNVHVFNWDGNNKYSLAGAADIWKKYVDIIESSQKYKHKYLLEFMPGGDISELMAESAALHEILDQRK